MRKIDTMLERKAPHFFKTTIMAAAFMGLASMAVAQNSYFTSTSDFCAVASNSATATKYSKDAVKTNLKSLFEEQVTLTHTMIQGIMDESPWTDAVKVSLQQNQQSIVQALSPFISYETAGNLSILFNQHVMLTYDLVSAVRVGDTYGIDQSVDAWRDNGDQIAKLFNQNIPAWKSVDSKQAIRNYLKMTVMMGEAIYKDNLAAEIKAYNKAMAANIQIQTKLTDALINSYAAKFIDDTNAMVAE